MPRVTLMLALAAASPLAAAAEPGSTATPASHHERGAPAGLAAPVPGRTAIGRDRIEDQQAHRVEDVLRDLPSVGGR